ncbi:hypothetical protein C8R46DRAFT_1110439 [Mycena filopes]|nr:hypothetical protein C8R46DRAFT_1110439 [Mycena filopes]
MSLEDEDPLAAALSHAFISSPSLRPEPQNSTQLAAASASTPTTESSVSSESLDSTSESEYESHVESWRAQSAEAREKAEKERARWEAIRAAEKQEAALRKAAIPEDSGVDGGEIVSDHGWETVGKTKEAPRPRPSSPSPADARDLVTGEPQKHVTPPETAAIPKSHSAQDPGDDSQKWEDVSSQLTSSFPSMSFPDRTNTPSPPPPPAPVESATLAIFDPSLSPRTRVTALFSSLAINFLLPFVNGVMLGFGEIFAKNIVLEYFGWRPIGPGTTAASRGIGASLQPSERNKTSSTSSAK